MSDAATAAPEGLLRRLAAGDEVSLRLVMTPGGGLAEPQDAAGGGLDRRTAALVRVAAMVAVDAPTASLRWAVERACAEGISDAALVAVLVMAAKATGAAQIVSSAPRLALALGFDTDVDAPDDV